jgi:hypothetical protein
MLNVEGQDVNSESLRKPFMLFPLRKSSVIQQENQSESQFGVRNNWLYALGMMLLEILLNSPLESYRENPGESRAQIAWRLEKLAMQHGGPRWAEIISRCLHCPFAEHPDLSNPAFLQKVYLEIMQPLLTFSKLPSISYYRRTTQARFVRRAVSPMSVSMDEAALESDGLEEDSTAGSRLA